MKRKFIKFPVQVLQSDIDKAKPCDAYLCMEKVAIERQLRRFPGEGSKDHKVRIDAGHFKFVLRRWRYKGDTPKKPRDALLRFDAKLTVYPHEWQAKAYQTTPVVKMPAERQEQINAARRARVAAGSQEHKRKYTLRDRVVGFDLGRGG